MENKTYRVFKYHEELDMWDILSVPLTLERAKSYKEQSCSTYKGSRLAIFQEIEMDNGK